MEKFKRVAVGLLFCICHMAQARSQSYLLLADSLKKEQAKEYAAKAQRLFRNICKTKTFEITSYQIGRREAILLGFDPLQCDRTKFLVAVTENFPTAFSVTREVLRSDKAVREKKEAVLEVPQAKREVVDPFADRRGTRSFGLWSLDKEWWALIALALVGIVAVSRSAIQIGKINRLQRELERYQKKNAQDLEMLERRL